MAILKLKSPRKQYIRFTRESIQNILMFDIISCNISQPGIEINDKNIIIKKTEQASMQKSESNEAKLQKKQKSF